ncbi:MAG TPA: hypothetical protein VKV21_05635 [Solirubrobacteraceae bacterium]|nr:hypothetical protein [Solirubrobacteraceae bacterium]
MSVITTRSRSLALGAVCAAAGAGAGTVAVAGASTGRRPASRGSAHQTPHARRGLARLARRTVHATLTVRTRDGFRTVTINRGTVDSVSGDTLTMTDGTRRRRDRRVTLTIPSDARVRNDRSPASLSSLTAGERVVVVQLPKRTIVRAHAPKRATRSS